MWTDSSGEVSCKVLKRTIKITYGRLCTAERYTAHIPCEVFYNFNLYFWYIRAPPAIHQNRAKGCLGKPNSTPAVENKPGQGMGPTSLGKPTGKSCLGSSPKALMSR
ncbi:hypothetical protein Pyn_19807 [Prunus yedoensis var. nudiflora]|uniref:Uncharacterized protein n=1 Tax=Prunus yedoensis var. nudiflora TaxID=2094558 RepID=A0A314XR94_PRUYE|nr:hypothetical protein Pyn_19807 [Prunus yedoensis var. nudiflora]